MVRLRESRDFNLGQENERGEKRRVFIVFGKLTLDKPSTVRLFR